MGNDSGNNLTEFAAIIKIYKIFIELNNAKQIANIEYPRIPVNTREYPKLKPKVASAMWKFVCTRIDTRKRDIYIDIYMIYIYICLAYLLVYSLFIECRKFESSRVGGRISHGA